MQASQNLSSLCRQRGFGRVASHLQRSPTLSPAIQAYGIQRRTQHDKFGPHKEYFQTPGNEPKPDLSPYVRGTQRTSQTEPQSRSIPSPAPSYGQTFPGQSLRPRSLGWIRLRRLIRSAIWFILFLQLGAAAGTALITWEYLSPQFEPGSEEEAELIEEILEALETHPVVQGLKEDQWVEVDAFTPDVKLGLKNRNMVHQVLGAKNTQGVFMRVFHHPTQEFTMLVFFLGFGVEGWPDVIHGGMITTLLQEAVSKHLGHYYRDTGITADNSTSIDFKKPCKPGDIYSVIVSASGRQVVKAGNVQLEEIQMTSMLLQLAGPPVVNTSHDPTTNTLTNSIGVAFEKGQTPLHAICRATVKLIPKQLTQDQGSFQIGAKDDGGFARALDILKGVPGFKGSSVEAQEEEAKKDKD